MVRSLRLPIILGETTQNAVTHAELLAIEQACEKLGTWRLEDAELYVTLEPCPMCSGAIIFRGLNVLFMGQPIQKQDVQEHDEPFEDERFNHQCEVVPGVLEEECGQLLQSFFQKLGKKKEGKEKKETELEQEYRN